jgi:hypothetical protein
LKHADTLVRDAAAYLLRRGSNLGTLGPHRAEIEFGNFSERIERRIGQEVRRGFRVGMNTIFSGTSRSERTLTSTAPRRVSRRTKSPGFESRRATLFTSPVRSQRFGAQRN